MAEMTQFDAAISALPYNPTTENGRGFLPAFMRASGHFLYLLGRLTDTPTRRPTDNQIKQEIESIQVHFTELEVPEYLSESIKTHAANFLAALSALDREIMDWDQDTRIANLQKLHNRAMQFMANLDREMLGIRNSDPGQEL